MFVDPPAEVYIIDSNDTFYKATLALKIAVVDFINFYEVSFKLVNFVKCLGLV